MNKLMHEVINKFHNINIICGTLAVEIESDPSLANDSVKVKKRIEELLEKIEEEFKRSNQLLIDITITSEKQNFYWENEHFFKGVKPLLPNIEKNKLRLQNLVNADKEPLNKTEITKLLQEIADDSLRCAVILKELRSSLIESGKYKVKKL